MHGLYAVLNRDGSSFSCLNIGSPRPFQPVFALDFLTFLIGECVYKFLASLVVSCHLKKLSDVYLRTNSMYSSVVMLNSV